MYCFSSEKKELCLRPEMTPSLVRMIMSLRVSAPLKWYSIAQCWRYETVTKYRKREHYQLNCDIVSGESIRGDVELLSLVVDIFKRYGLCADDITIRISHRQIISSYLVQELGVSEDQIDKILNIIDKIDKLRPDDIKCALMTGGLDDDKINKLMQFIKIDNINHELLPTNPHVLYMTELFALAKMYNLESWLKFDLGIVRGLSYYTGMVFECYCKDATLGIVRAVCGGGRYDKIMVGYGTAPNRAHSFAGFGMGDVVLTEILDKKKLLPVVKDTVDYCVLSVGDGMYGNCLRIASLIRSKQKYTLDVCMKNYTKLATAFAYAESIGASFVILLAPTEFAENKIVVKNMAAASDDVNKQIIIDVDEFINKL
jgi:histidyl-tRNA synthetase